MTEGHLRTDRVSIGEGFAFFRWHCLTFPWSVCRGINHDAPGFGPQACVPMWMELRRG